MNTQHQPSKDKIYLDGQLRDFNNKTKEVLITQTHIGSMQFKKPAEQTAGVKYDQGKARYDLVPILAEEEIANVFTYGANKYNEAFDEENWRKLDHQFRRLYAATRRHMQAVSKGEHYDKESGLHHYAHACSNLMMIMQLDLELKQLHLEQDSEVNDE